MGSGPWAKGPEKNYCRATVGHETHALDRLPRRAQELGLKPFRRWPLPQVTIFVGYDGDQEAN